jgi:hypothetical protein
MKDKKKKPMSSKDMSKRFSKGKSNVPKPKKKDC